MATFLFDKIIFGPVKSRRLGISLGINVMQPTSKHCNFDCIYCECGWNGDHPRGSFNSVEAICSRLEAKLEEMGNPSTSQSSLEESCGLPDVITFAGNGEPTMHPDFEVLIDRVIAIRERLAPNCQIAVLSNATMIDRPGVVRALKRVERNILKLDSVIPSTQILMNQPNNPRSIDLIIQQLKQFGGQLIIQTMFMRGRHQGQVVDNTTEEEISQWLLAIKEIAPSEVMLYSIDRDTPAQGLERVSREELLVIAQRVESLGIRVSVA